MTLEFVCMHFLLSLKKRLENVELLKWRSCLILFSQLHWLANFMPMAEWNLWILPVTKQSVNEWNLFSAERPVNQSTKPHYWVSLPLAACLGVRKNCISTMWSVQNRPTLCFPKHVLIFRVLVFSLSVLPVTEGEFNNRHFFFFHFHPFVVRDGFLSDIQNLFLFPLQIQLAI